MRQNIDYERFLNDIKPVDGAFQQTEIAQKMGFSEGEVSKVFGKNKKPSKNFYNKFYNVFKDFIGEVKKEETTEEKLSANEATLLSLKNYVAKYIAKKENREFSDVLKEMSVEEIATLNVLLKRK